MKPDTDSNDTVKPKSLTVGEIDALSAQLDAGTLHDCPACGRGCGHVDVSSAPTLEEVRALLRMARAVAVLERPRWVSVSKIGGQWCVDYVTTIPCVGLSLIDAIEAADAAQARHP